MVDAENASKAIITLIACEYLKANGYDVSIIKAVADWTQPHDHQWKTAISKSGIEPIQSVPSRKKRNSSDIALCVHACEVIYTWPNIQALVLISSDGDFTPLVQKAKSRGILTVGIGNKDTPLLFRSNCHVWFYTDFFENQPKNTTYKTLEEQIDAAFDMGVDRGSGLCSLPKLGQLLYRNNPEFILEEYFRSGKLSDAIISLKPKYELFTGSNGGMQVKRNTIKKPNNHE